MFIFAYFNNLIAFLILKTPANVKTFVAHVKEVAVPYFSLMPLTEASLVASIETFEGLCKKVVLKAFRYYGLISIFFMFSFCTTYTVDLLQPYCILLNKQLGWPADSGFLGLCYISVTAAGFLNLILIFGNPPIVFNLRLGFWSLYFAFFIYKNVQVVLLLGSHFAKLFHCVYVLYIFILIYFLYLSALFFLFYSLTRIPPITKASTDVKGRFTKIRPVIDNSSFKNFLIKQKEFSKLELTFTQEDFYLFVWSIVEFFVYLLYLLLDMILMYILGILFFGLAFGLGMFFFAYIPLELNKYISMYFPKFGHTILVIFYYPAPLAVTLAIFNLNIKE